MKKLFSFIVCLSLSCSVNITNPKLETPVQNIVEKINIMGVWQNDSTQVYLSIYDTSYVGTSSKLNYKWMTSVYSPRCSRLDFSKLQTYKISNDTVTFNNERFIFCLDSNRHLLLNSIDTDSLNLTGSYKRYGYIFIVPVAY
jgi:hypothetical protein